MQLPAVGIWTFNLELLPSRGAGEAAAEIQALGYRAVWIPETMGRDALLHASLLLGATSDLIVATGIAGIWARDAMAMQAGHLTLAEAFPDRFLLGIGVSHQPLVEGFRGHRYDRPWSAMRAYLDGMDAAPYFAPKSDVPPTRVLAALGPKMLTLAAERAAGAHTYFVPVEHTAAAREVVGPDPWLAVEQAVVLETDAGRARELARGHTQMYLGLPNYRNNLVRQGFSDEDLAGAGSDRLVDAIVAWGDEDAIAARVAEQRAAGATHVCLQVLTDDPRTVPMDTWRRLAPALLD